jgi:hypothetical protein
MFHECCGKEVERFGCGLYYIGGLVVLELEAEYVGEGAWFEEGDELQEAHVLYVVFV